MRKIGNELINDNNEKTPTVYATIMQIFFLSSIKIVRKYIVLVPHNVFVDKHLIMALHRTGLTDDFKSILAGFSDMLPAFRKKYPWYLPQSDLYTSIVRGSYQAHSAKLVTVSKVQFIDLFHSSKCPESAINHVR